MSNIVRELFSGYGLILRNCGRIGEVIINSKGCVDLSGSSVTGIDARSVIGASKCGISLVADRTAWLKELNLSVPGSVHLDYSCVKRLGPGFSCGMDGDGVSVSYAQEPDPRGCDQTLEVYCQPPVGKMIGSVVVKTPSVAPKEIIF
jgi:hypothetical protein